VDACPTSSGIFQRNEQLNLRRVAYRPYRGVDRLTLLHYDSYRLHNRGLLSPTLFVRPPVHHSAGLTIPYHTLQANLEQDIDTIEGIFNHRQETTAARQRDIGQEMAGMS
jgi:hypothetical protein